MDDLDQIKQLKARYFRMMDTKDWDGLAAVFTDDVEIDMSNEGGGVTTSVADYMPFLRANIEIALDRPDLGPELADYLRALVRDRLS